MEGIFRYTVKYGKAWKAKLAAIEILYGGWKELYNHLFYGVRKDNSSKPRHVPCGGAPWLD
jgi:hypothetical protein